jgi:hypothetical protein
MPKFDQGQILSFLHSLDVRLKGNLEIFLIGGMASMLGYGADVKTADMDVLTIHAGTEDDLKQAMRGAREATGFGIFLDRASIAELPYNYEERTKLLRGVAFKKLKVNIPDKYDLVLSKTLRAYPHDLDAIESIHVRHPLSENTLVKRFEEDFWKQATADPRKFAFNMSMVLSLLYGEDRAKHHMAKWEAALATWKWA